MSSCRTGYISPSDEKHIFALLQDDDPERKLRSMTVVIKDIDGGDESDDEGDEEWNFEVWIHMIAKRGTDDDEKRDTDDDDDDSGFELNDGILDMDMWRRFGEVVRNSNTLEEFKFYVESIPDNRQVQLLAATGCVNAFFEEAKHNNSIRCLKIELGGLLNVQDVSHFIVNNKSLKDLTLYSVEPISLQDSNVLASAISNSSLEGIDIQECNFDNNDGSFQRMLSGCSTCDLLLLLCKTNWHVTALAAMLENPATVVVYLVAMVFHTNHVPGDLSFDYPRAAREITTSLEKNMHLESVYFGPSSLSPGGAFLPPPAIVSQINMDMEKLLCNISTINDIINSNHGISFLCMGNFDPMGNGNVEQLRQCLELNRNEDKAEVIRNKILRFYFVGEYDVSPLAKMSLSVLPEVISQIGGDNKHSAIYRLLRLLTQPET